MSDIKIFVSCHKDNQCVPSHELLCPIQVGTSLNDKVFKGFYHDNEGDNISSLNKEYCELTAQYYAWKNIDTDYYGFFHYRRYLYPNTKTKRPYSITKSINDKTLKHYNFDSLKTLIEQNDLILPIGEDMHISVKDHYANAKYHHIRDLGLVEQIINEKYPEYVKSMKDYLNNSVCYFGNIFIMSKELFNNYCHWLFTILFEFDKRKDVKTYNVQEKRVNGYLSERLLGIFVSHNIEKYKSIELPRLFIEENNVKRISLKLTNFLLPPSSKRRAVIKRSKEATKSYVI